MKQKISLANVLTYLGILVLILAIVSQVRSTSISTGNYYLDTPLPIASFYVGKYTNGTIFAINGSNWRNFLRTTNASYLFEMCIGNLTLGGKIIVATGVYQFPTTVSISQEGVYIEGEATVYGSKGTVFNFTGTNGALFKFTHATTHLFFGGIKNAELRGNDGTGTIGILVDKYWSDIWFEQLFIRDFADAGIKVRGGQGEAASDEAKTWNIWIKNCLIEENQVGTGYGVYLTDADSKNHSISRVTIDDCCHFASNIHSLYVDAEYVFNLAFCGNTVEQEKQHSIYLKGGRRVLINNNRMFDVGTDATNTYDYIFVSGETSSPPVVINIVGNTIGNHWITDSARYTIHLNGTCDHILIADNTFETDGGTAVLNQNSSGTDITVRCNQGYVTENWGNFTSISNGTWVSHGLVTTPTQVVFTLSVQGYAWLGGSNSTKVQVYANVATVSGSWFAKYIP